MTALRYIAAFGLSLLVGTTFIRSQVEINQDSIKTLLQSLEGEDHINFLLELSENEDLSADTRLAYAEDAVEYARDIESTEYSSASFISFGKIKAQVHDYEEAIQAYQEAFDLSQEGNYPAGMAEAKARMGRAYIYLPDQELAAESLDEALLLAREIRNREIEARTLMWMGLLQRTLNGDLEASIGYYQEALPIARESELQTLEAEILAELGLVMYMKGDFSGAIEHFEPAAPLFRAVGEKFGEARIYVLLGNSNTQLARDEIALGWYQEALPIFEEINSTPGIAAVLSGMAAIYFSGSFYDKALEMNFQKLELSRETGDEIEIGNTLNNIANVYSQIASDSLDKMFGSNFTDSIKFEPSDKYLEFFADALDYYQQALEVRERVNDKRGQAATLYNLGITYLNSGKADRALSYLERALVLNQELDNRQMEADLFLTIGQVHLANENYPEAGRYLNQSLEIARELDVKKTLQYLYLSLSDLNFKLRNFETALAYYKQYSAIKDTLNQKERMDMISEMQVKYETEATEKENQLLLTQSELADTKLRQTRIILIITVIAIGVFLVMVVQLIRQNNLKKKANRELEHSNALITEQKKEITDSIQYASRIQNAMLPPGDYVDKLLPERFIIFMPRDIVSGDYYYITEKDEKIICVAADCTGHGVPGAFMSMLGIAFLNEIISKHAELHTDEMLSDLRNHVIKSLHQTGKEGESQDGMDLAVYIADLKNKKIEFSGANNSMYIFRDGKMIEAKADKMPIGIHTRVKENFTRHKLDLKKGDMIYTFSDGYPDQFGGPNQKKFMIRNFKRLLSEIHEKSMSEQKKILEDTLAGWMAEANQVDDILVIGVRV